MCSLTLALSCSTSGSCQVLCCAVLCCAVLCCAVLCCAVLCCAVLCCAVLCCAVLCCAVLCCAVLCCAVLCCVLGRAVLSRAVLCLCIRRHILLDDAVQHHGFALLDTAWHFVLLLDTAVCIMIQTNLGFADKKLPTERAHCYAPTVPLDAPAGFATAIN